MGRQIVVGRLRETVAAPHHEARSGRAAAPRRASLAEQIHDIGDRRGQRREVPAQCLARAPDLDDAVILCFAQQAFAKRRIKHPRENRYNVKPDGLQAIPR